MILHPVIPDILQRREQLTDAIRKGHLTPELSRYAQPGWAYILKKDGNPSLAYPSIGNFVGEDEETGAISYVVTTDEEDRDGDIVRPNGAQLKNYSLNPIVFFGHQEKPIPIGVCRSPDGRITVYPEENRMVDTIYFDLHDTDAALIHDKCRRKILNATSIAFVPIEAWRRDDVRKARTHGDQSQSPPGWYFNQWDKTEVSIVGVPSNPKAVGLEKQLQEACRDVWDRERGEMSPNLQKAWQPYVAQAKGCWGGWCPLPGDEKDIGGGVVLKAVEKSGRTATIRQEPHPTDPSQTVYAAYDADGFDLRVRRRTREELERDLRIQGYAVGEKSVKSPCSCDDCAEGKACPCAVKDVAKANKVTEAMRRLATSFSLPFEANDLGADESVLRIRDDSKIDAIRRVLQSTGWTARETAGGGLAVKQLAKVTKTKEKQPMADSPEQLAEDVELKEQPSDDIDPEKACQALKSGTVYGEPLTDSQRRVLSAACAKAQKSHGGLRETCKALVSKGRLTQYWSHIADMVERHDKDGIKRWLMDQGLNDATASSIVNTYISEIAGTYRRDPSATATLLLERADGALAIAARRQQTGKSLVSKSHQYSVEEAIRLAESAKQEVAKYGVNVNGPKHDKIVEQIAAKFGSTDNTPTSQGAVVNVSKSVQADLDSPGVPGRNANPSGMTGQEKADSEGYAESRSEVGQKVEVTSGSYQGGYTSIIDKPRGLLQWRDDAKPGSVPIPDSTMQRWIREGKASMKALSQSDGRIGGYTVPPGGVQSDKKQEPLDDVQPEGWTACEGCHGDGNCEACGGTGTFAGDDDCPECDGSGDCGACAGEGHVEKVMKRKQKQLDVPNEGPSTPQVLAALYSHAKAEAAYLDQLDDQYKDSLADYRRQQVEERMDMLKYQFSRAAGPDDDIEKLCKDFEDEHDKGMTSTGPDQTVEPGEAGLVDQGQIPETEVEPSEKHHRKGRNMKQNTVPADGAYTEDDPDTAAELDSGSAPFNKAAPGTEEWAEEEMQEPEHKAADSYKATIQVHTPNIPKFEAAMRSAGVELVTDHGLANDSRFHVFTVRGQREAVLTLFNKFAGKLSKALSIDGGELRAGKNLKAAEDGEAVIDKEDDEAEEKAPGTICMCGMEVPGDAAECPGCGAPTEQKWNEAAPESDVQATEKIIYGDDCDGADNDDPECRTMFANVGRSHRSGVRKASDPRTLKLDLRDTPDGQVEIYAPSTGESFGKFANAQLANAALIKLQRGEKSESASEEPVEVKDEDANAVTDPAAEEILERYRNPKSLKWSTRKHRVSKTLLPFLKYRVAANGKKYLVRAKDHGGFDVEQGTAADGPQAGKWFVTGPTGRRVAGPFSSQSTAQEEAGQLMGRQSSTSQNVPKAIDDLDDSEVKALTTKLAGAIDDLKALVMAKDLPRQYKAGLKHVADTIWTVGKALTDKGKEQKNGGSGSELTETGKVQANGGKGSELKDKGEQQGKSPTKSAKPRQVSPAVQQKLEETMAKLKRFGILNGSV